MSLLQDGGTADPAMWGEWLEAIQRVEKSQVNDNLEPTS